MVAQLFNQGDVAVLALSGRVNIEKTAFLRNACLGQLKNAKVIFNMQGLSFVGSSGIQNLFNLAEELKSNCGCDVKIVGLSQDFQRLWSHTSKTLPVFESLDKALVSFQGPVDEII